MTNATCPRCGIRERRGGHGYAYCAPCMSEYQAERRKARIAPRNCIICGTEYRSPYPHTLTCSKECARNRERQINGKTAIPQGQQKCPVCGRLFVMRNSTHMYCSRTCKYSGSDAVRERRAHMRASSLPFTLEQRRSKFAYWGNRCWMCNAPATTLDHVKPIVAGGPHILANFRPACRSCNSSKGGRWFGVTGLEQFKVA